MGICWFQNSFSLYVFTTFRGGCKFWTPLNQKGPNLWFFLLKNGLKTVFDSSKEASWCTDYNAKTPSSLESTVTEKIKNNLQKYPFLTKNAQNGIFFRFLFIFSETVLCKELGFLRCIQCIKVLLSSYQNSFQTIFQQTTSKNYLT